MRQWWKEDSVLTQKYYNEQLNQNGKAPEELTPYLAEIIIKQHLHTEAMLAIFPIQEFLQQIKSFRIRMKMQKELMFLQSSLITGVQNAYWIRRFIKNKSFNQKIANWITTSGR